MIRRLWRYGLIRWSVRLGVIIVLLNFVPLLPWRPINCLKETAVGELSEAYAEVMAYSFAYHDVYYWRLGNTIFLRILPTRDATKDWPRSAVINNAEWKNAQDVINGRAVKEVDGHYYPIPEAVRRAQAMPETDPDDPEFDRDCAVFAAAVLEDRRWPL